MLSGINFGSATVWIEANNVTIKDCTFSGTTSYWAVYQSPNASGATVENCTFQGTKSPTETNVSWITSVLGITIKDNSFLVTPWDAIDLGSGGVVWGEGFSGAGYAPGARRMRFGSLVRQGRPPSLTISSMEQRTPTPPLERIAIFGLPLIRAI